MPLLPTKYFGLMEYDASAIVDFPFGIPAFENEQRFLLIEQPSMAPLLFLQSLTQADLCFLTLPVLNLESGYQLSILSDDIRAFSTIHDKKASEQSINVLQSTQPPYK